jgi:hypothetical protein
MQRINRSCKNEPCKMSASIILKIRAREKLGGRGTNCVLHIDEICPDMLHGIDNAEKLG